MAKQELLATVRDPYRASSKREESRILDEFIAVAGHHCKLGIRLLAQPVDGRRKVRAAERWRMLRRGGPCLGQHHSAWPCSVQRLQFPPNPTRPPVGWSSG